MAFPSEHVFPFAIPQWHIDGHILRADERVEQTPYEQGEDRQRELRSFTPFLVSVKTMLLQDQFDRFDEWFEVDLQGGTQLFDTKVAGVNGSLSQWWQAMFVGPYRYEASYRNSYIVTAELILLDGPYDATIGIPQPGGGTGPVRVAPSINSRGLVETDGRATFEEAALQARGLVETDGWFIFDMSISARGLVETDGWVILGEPDEDEDSDTRFVEPGDDRLIESGEARLTE